MKIAQKKSLFATMAMALATNATQMKIAQKKVLFATVMDRATNANTTTHAKEEKHAELESAKLATLHIKQFLPLTVTLFRASAIYVTSVGMQNRAKRHAACVI